jgi:predicted ATP-dependent endonuclease of OLD family
MQIQWRADAFRFRLPVEPTRRAPMLNAIMGANSAGKSSILLALQLAFGNSHRLDASMFNAKRTREPVIVEITVEGRVAAPTQWHATNCQVRDERYRLTVAHLWTTGGRTRMIRRPDGEYYKQTARDREMCEALLPEFRIIWADTRLTDEIDPEKNSLMGDLLDALLARVAAEDSVVTRLQAAIDELRRLADRRTSEDPMLWKQVEELEASLSAGLAAITPQPKRVRLQLESGIPTVRALLAKGTLLIDDGVELDFDRHGLGLQRSFVVSALSAWCEFIRDAAKDYVFAIEEPEIYLHPHATRVLLNTLEKIARHDQVLFTTHASEFVNRVPLAQVLMVKRCDKQGAIVSRVKPPDLRGLPADEIAKVQRYLREDRSDMLFARAVVLVEGQAEFFALPGFARTLGRDLDGRGVSVVFVNGIGNFPTYHHILAAFGIPHVILVDGDGHRGERMRQYAAYADAAFVLEKDFEHLLVEGLSTARLLAVMNECLRRRGRESRQTAPAGRHAARELAELGKPLVGAVVSEMLNPEEIARMPVLVELLDAAVALGGVRAGTPER